MLAMLVAGLALAQPHTIQLDRLAAPTVDGHPIASERDAARLFGTPSQSARCTAAWRKLTLTLDTCGIGPEITVTSTSWRTTRGLHPGDTSARAHALYPQGRPLDFLERGTLWQLETGGALCDGGPTLALAAKLAAGRVVALEVVRVPACG